MADTHLQVNHDGSTSERKTSLWPSSKSSQELVIKSIFEYNGWSVSTIQNISGSHWKIKVSCPIKELNLNLYISSIRDESRQPDEFKMQLGTSYPTDEEDGWINLVLGIYAIEEDGYPTEYILSGYEITRYDFSTNPSIRGTRTSGLQKARLIGMYVTEKSVLFRPEYIYYYIESQRNKQFTTIPDNPTTEIIDITKTHSVLATALRTKPFLLLAGISGTGKSQKVQELAFMTCPEELREENSTTPGNYCLVEVKPNWHDSTELLGYYSALSGRYELTDFIRFTYKALTNSNTPFFLCLDEMNLAPVEQYFAEYLSVLETRKRIVDEEGVKILTEPLLTKDKFSNCTLKERVPKQTTGYMLDGDEYDEKPLYSPDDAEIIAYLKNNGLHLPDNLFVIGTVNMDDTTHQFSRKVIDRAFTIEMNGGKMDEMFSTESRNNLEYRTEPLPRSAFKSEFVRAYEVLEDDRFAKYKDAITTRIPELLGNSDGTASEDSINGILNGTPFRVSYRVQNELVLYLSVLIENAGFPDDIESLIGEATLAILMEKVLPRIQGEQKQLETKGGKSNVLKDMKSFVETHFKPSDETVPEIYDKVIKKLDEMDGKLSGYYTNFF